jgi:hypothetical protein
MTPEDIEAKRERAGLRTDRDYSPLNRMQEYGAFSRLIARDGSVWPARDTGHRHA